MNTSNALDEVGDPVSLSLGFKDDLAHVPIGSYPQEVGWTKGRPKDQPAQRNEYKTGGQIEVDGGVCCTQLTQEDRSRQQPQNEEKAGKGRLRNEALSPWTTSHFNPSDRFTRDGNDPPPPTFLGHLVGCDHHPLVTKLVRSHGIHAVHIPCDRNLVNADGYG